MLKSKGITNIEQGILNVEVFKELRYEIKWRKQFYS